jgi:hypothetical protein
MARAAHSTKKPIEMPTETNKSTNNKTTKTITNKTDNHNNKPTINPPPSPIKSHNHLIIKSKKKVSKIKNNNKIINKNHKSDSKEKISKRNNPYTNTKTKAKTNKINKPNENSNASYQPNINDMRETPNHIKLLTCVSWNCNSVRKKFTTIATYMKKNNIKIMGLSETKCFEEEANDILALKKYKIYFKCREKNPTHGGGVAIIIDENISHEQIKDIPENIEAVGITIKINGKKTAIVNYYNPPKIILSSDFIYTITQNYKEYLIMGDLNVHITPFAKTNNENGNVLQQLILNTNISILNDELTPTSYRLNTVGQDNVLDFFLGSECFNSNLKAYRVELDSILLAKEYLYFHAPIRANFNFIIEKKSNYISQHCPFNYAKADWNEFKKNIIKNDKSTTKNIDELSKNISTNISNSAIKSIPKVNINNNYIEKLPEEIVHLIRIKNKYMRNFYKKRKDEDKDIYYSLKKCIEKEIEIIRNEKMNRFIDGLGKSPISTIPFWRRIGRMRNKNKKQEIPDLKHENVVAKTDEEKATMFGKRLKQIYTNDQEINNEQDSRQIKNINEAIENLKTQSTKDFKKFSVNELKDEIKKLNQKTSIDSDKICNKMLKNLPDEFLPTLIVLFNLIVKKREIPSDWKCSTIKMIHKKGGDANSPIAYRPISITSCLMRLLEKIVLSRIEKFLKISNILIKEQSGFRAQRQTRDNLFTLIQKATEGFNRKTPRKTLCVLFDLEKAFDKMWHNALLFKLIKIKVPIYIILFIQVFLKGRTFRVQVNSFVTSYYEIGCGCPQGAVLSPRLFTFYINDIPICSDKQSNTLLFADDVMFMSSYTRLTKTIINNWNTYLKALEEWSIEWKLNFAPTKCSFSIFSKANIEKDIETMDLKMYNLKINYDPAPRFLGITFDKNLNFSNHIETIKKSCVSRLNILKIFSYGGWSLTPETMIGIYKALIRSLIDYASFAFNCMDKKNRNSLQTIQNNAIRICYKFNYDKISKNQLSTTEIHKIANIETIEERCNTLKKDYLENAINSSNPIICKIIKEFKSFDNGKTLKHPTPLSNTSIHSYSIKIN